MVIRYPAGPARKALQVSMLVGALMAGQVPGAALAAGDGGNGYGTNLSQAGSFAFRQARALVAEGEYLAAIPKLEQVTLAEPDNADAFNLLAFSYRKSGDTDRAAPNYERALQINPNHRGALEYQGEMFLTLNQPEKAEANLARINDICWLRCEEAEDLERAIAEWRAANGS